MKTSSAPFVSLTTRSLEVLSKTTKRPLGLRKPSLYERPLPLALILLLMLTKVVVGSTRAEAAEVRIIARAIV
jgi:hypothetical protein